LANCKWFRPAQVAPLPQDTLGASARDLIDERNPTLVATAAPLLMIAIFALPQMRALFAFGLLHGPTPHRWRLLPSSSSVTQEGYDDLSQIILDTNGFEFDPIQDAPTKKDAERAISEIDNCIAEFPFDGNPGGKIKCASRTVALSLILSAQTVGSLDHIPMHLGDAAAAGTGKGQLGNVASLIATGRTVSRMTQGRDETEDEKRLVGAVIKGWLREGFPQGHVDSKFESISNSLSSRFAQSLLGLA
jgi:hypothetical protein